MRFVVAPSGRPIAAWHRKENDHRQGNQLHPRSCKKYLLGFRLDQVWLSRALAEFGFQQLEPEGVPVHRLARRWQGDFHEPPRAAGSLVRGPQFVQERVAFPGALAGAPQRAQRAQEAGEFAPTDRYFLRAPVLALDQDVHFLALRQKFDFDRAAQLGVA